VPYARIAVGVILASLLVAGCGGSPASPPAPAPTLGPAPTGASGPPATASPTSQPTGLSTPAPSFVPPTVATFAPAGASTATWDLVALGDSNVSGWGVRSDESFSPQAAFPGVYAGLLGAEQGVTVVLHSYYPDQLGNEWRTIAEWTDVLRADASMRADLAGAEIVVLLIGFHNLLPFVLGGACPSGWPELRDCLVEMTASMPADFDTLYGEIASLVPNGATVLVNDYGIPGPVYDRWSSEPFWPEFRKVYFEDWRDALEAAAVKHGFTVVHSYAAMNDPDGKPVWDSSAVTSDGWHFNAEGHRICAEIVLAEDGLSAP